MITIISENIEKSKNTLNDALSAMKDNKFLFVTDDIFECSLNTMKESIELALKKIQQIDWEQYHEK